MWPARTRRGTSVPPTRLSALTAQGPLLFAFHSELPDQCSPDPCNKKGTHVCQDLMGNFYSLVTQTVKNLPAVQETQV